MQQNPQEANSSAANLRKSLIIWTVKVQSHIYKTLSVVPGQSQRNPVHSIPSYFYQINLLVQYNRFTQHAEGYFKRQMSG